MKYRSYTLAVMIILIITFVLACSLPERINGPPELSQPGPSRTFSLAKSGSILGSKTRIYAAFTSPRDTWQKLDPSGYSVPTVLETYFGLRSGNTPSDSMLVFGISVETSKGSYPAVHYETSVNGAFFWIQPMPDSTINIPRGNNLADIRWVTIGPDSTTSTSTLDNWAGTRAKVRLPMVKGSIARCWVIDAPVNNVHASSWTKRTGGTRISEIQLNHLVPSGDGWVFEFGMRDDGTLYNTGSNNIHIVIRPE